MEKEWTIQLFAGLAERLGGPLLNLPAKSETLTVKALKQALSDKFPEHGEIIRVSFLASNQQYASENAVVHIDDELAMLPPVSGGEDTEILQEEDSRFFISAEPLSIETIASKVNTPGNGAALLFVGTTREWTHGKRTIRLEYEAYAPMAVRMMVQIGEEIEARWPGSLSAIGHRIGVVEIAETSVVIAVSSPHREACYEASRYAIERLKQIVPIWKREIWEDGSEWKGHQSGPWNPVSEQPTTL